MLIGSAWSLGIEIDVPDIVGQVSAMSDAEEQDWSVIRSETEPNDPSRLRDITDPIYHSCWWRAQYPIDSGSGYDLLARSYHVSQLPHP
jgi:hypothetical protein